MAQTSLSEDLELIDQYEEFIKLKPSEMSFDFRTTKKQRYVIYIIIKNRSLPAARLRKYFSHRGRLENFLTDLSEVEEVIKTDGNMVWLNPDWLEKQKSLFRKKKEEKK